MSHDRFQFKLGFFLFGSSFLGCWLLRGFFRRSFCLRLHLFRFIASGRRGLLRFCFFLRRFGSLEALPIEADFRDPNGGEWLAMPAQLLVLFFSLVMKYENF